MRLTGVRLRELAYWTSLLHMELPDDAVVELHVLPNRWELRVEGRPPFVMEPDEQARDRDYRSAFRLPGETEP